MVPTLTADAPGAAEPVDPAADLPAWCYPKQYRMLLSEVGEHELTVLHSDGLYRHLRFAKPGTRIWSFDLITWPGYLTIVGDIGSGYTFSREEDMLTFFDTRQKDGHINAGYWAEKVAGNGKWTLKSFSSEVFTEYVNGLVDDWAQEMSEQDAARLRTAVTSEVLDYAHYDDAASDALASFTFDGRPLDDDRDPRAWQDYDHHFLIALHAILWGAKKYHAHLAAQS